MTAPHGPLPPTAVALEGRCCEAHPYRAPAQDVEHILVVPEGPPGPVLAQLVAEGWSVVGRQGAGWLLRR
jgi:hypothetical protein